MPDAQRPQGPGQQRHAGLRQAPLALLRSSTSCSSSSATTWTGSRSSSSPRDHRLFEPEWNDFDRLTPETRLLHNTKRWNQPWKTGLPVDFHPAANTPLSRMLAWFLVPQTVLGRYALLGHYRRHWDPNQERFFFGLLRECLERAWSPSRCCARRWRAITCATMPWSWSSVPRRLPPDRRGPAGAAPWPGVPVVGSPSASGSGSTAIGRAARRSRTRTAR